MQLTSLQYAANFFQYASDHQGWCLAGQEDQLQIDGINRLIKVMQEIASPSSSALPTRTKAAQTRKQTVATTMDSSGRPVAYTGPTSGSARLDSPQTAVMRNGTPVSTSNRGYPAAVTTLQSTQSASSSSLDRSEAVQGNNPVEAIQQTVQMLQWFVQEASQLPAAARLEALR